MDQGDTWETLSGDLTRGGLPGNVPFGTLTTLAEHPNRFGQLAAGSDDGLVHGYSTDDLSSVLWSGRGHEDAVQGVCFDPADTLLVSTSTDCTFRIWS